MQPTRLNAEEVARMTDASAHLFVARHVHDYWPCILNSQKVCNFITSQVGEDYPYPWPIDFFENAFAYLNEHDFLLQRPIEEPEIDPAVAREQAAQQKVRDDYDARQTAAKLERDRNLPLNELAKVVSVQNAQLRKIRETSGLPVRSTGMESRHVEQVKLGIPAQARVNVGLAQPELSPKSAEFTKLYAAELARLRGQQ
jgi:hypothetical protein